MKTKLMTQTIYDFCVGNNAGKVQALSEYKDHVILVVNVASKCGFTPQYVELEQLYQRYQNQGFVILAFPCNQFGQQEPAADAQIQLFCQQQYNVTFPVFSKVDVNGSHALPLFTFLKQQCPGVAGTKTIKWNFTKFLLNRHGLPVARFAPQTKPHKIADSIEALL